MAEVAPVETREEYLKQVCNYLKQGQETGQFQYRRFKPSKRGLQVRFSEIEQRRLAADAAAPAAAAAAAQPSRDISSEFAIPEGKHFIVGDLHGYIEKAVVALLGSGAARFKREGDPWKKITREEEDFLIPNLELNLEFFATDSKQRLTFLGDYIDRGPASTECLLLMTDLMEQQEDLCRDGRYRKYLTALLGNHELGEKESREGVISLEEQRRIPLESKIVEEGVERGFFDFITSLKTRAEKEVILCHGILVNELKPEGGVKERFDTRDISAINRDFICKFKEGGATRTGLIKRIALPEMVGDFDDRDVDTTRSWIIGHDHKLYGFCSYDNEFKPTDTKKLEVLGAIAAYDSGFSGYTVLREDGVHFEGLGFLEGCPSCSRELMRNTTTSSLRDQPGVEIFRETSDLRLPRMRVAAAAAAAVGAAGDPAVPPPAAAAAVAAAGTGGDGVDADIDADSIDRDDRAADTEELSGSDSGEERFGEHPVLGGRGGGAAALPDLSRRPLRKGPQPMDSRGIEELAKIGIIVDPAPAASSVPGGLGAAARPARKIKRRIVSFADTHGDHASVQFPHDFGKEGDILVFAGDLDSTSRRAEDSKVCFEDFVNRIRHAGYKKSIVYVPGNHDHFVESLYKQHGYREAKKKLKDDHNVVLAINEAVEVEGVRFFGYPWTVNQPGRPMGTFQNRHRTEDDKHKNFQECLAAAQRDGGVDVVVTHDTSSSLGKRRRSNRKKRTADGFSAQKIIQVAPEAKLHICGHIHLGKDQDIDVQKRIRVQNANIKRKKSKLARQATIRVRARAAAVSARRGLASLATVRSFRQLTPSVSGRKRDVVRQVVAAKQAKISGELENCPPLRLRGLADSGIKFSQLPIDEAATFNARDLRGDPFPICRVFDPPSADAGGGLTGNTNAGQAKTFVVGAGGINGAFAGKVECRNVTTQYNAEYLQAGARRRDSPPFDQTTGEGAVMVVPIGDDCNSKFGIGAMIYVVPPKLLTMNRVDGDEIKIQKEAKRRVTATGQEWARKIAVYNNNPPAGRPEAQKITCARLNLFSGGLYLRPGISSTDVAQWILEGVSKEAVELKQSGVEKIEFGALEFAPVLQRARASAAAARDPAASAPGMEMAISFAARSGELTRPPEFPATPTANIPVLAPPLPPEKPPPPAAAKASLTPPARSMIKKWLLRARRKIETTTGAEVDGAAAGAALPPPKSVPATPSVQRFIYQEIDVLPMGTETEEQKRRKLRYEVMFAELGCSVPNNVITREQLEKEKEFIVQNCLRKFQERLEPESVPVPVPVLVAMTICYGTGEQIRSASSSARIKPTDCALIQDVGRHLSEHLLDRAVGSRDLDVGSRADQRMSEQTQEDFFRPPNFFGTGLHCVILNDGAMKEGFFEFKVSEDPDENSEIGRYNLDAQGREITKDCVIKIEAKGRSLEQAITDFRCNGLGGVGAVGAPEVQVFKRDKNITPKMVISPSFYKRGEGRFVEMDLSGMGVEREVTVCPSLPLSLDIAAQKVALAAMNLGENPDPSAPVLPSKRKEQPLRFSPGTGTGMDPSETMENAVVAGVGGEKIRVGVS